MSIKNCPFCGESVTQRPRHLSYCEEIPTDLTDSEQTANDRYQKRIEISLWRVTSNSDIFYSDQTPAVCDVRERTNWVRIQDDI
jgi:hypothetical protein